ncbi:hypothetical protein ACVI1J_009667 [Bradyrhizobium diazoefficiens]
MQVEHVTVPLVVVKGRGIGPEVEYAPMEFRHPPVAQPIREVLVSALMKKLFKNKTFLALLALLVVLTALLVLSDPTLSSKFRYRNF